MTHDHGTHTRHTAHGTRHNTAPRVWKRERTLGGERVRGGEGYIGRVAMTRSSGVSVVEGKLSAALRDPNNRLPPRKEGDHTKWREDEGERERERGWIDR